MVQSHYAVEIAPMNGIRQTNLCQPQDRDRYRAGWPTVAARPPTALGMWCAWGSCGGGVNTGSLPFYTARGASLDLLGSVTSLVARDAVAPSRVCAKLGGAGIGRENALNIVSDTLRKLTRIMKASGLEGQP